MAWPLGRPKSTAIRTSYLAPPTLSPIEALIGLPAPVDDPFPPFPHTNTGFERWQHRCPPAMLPMLTQGPAVAASGWTWRSSCLASGCSCHGNAYHQHSAEDLQAEEAGQGSSACCRPTHSLQRAGPCSSRTLHMTLLKGDPSRRAFAINPPCNGLALALNP